MNTQPVKKKEEVEKHSNTIRTVTASPPAGVLARKFELLASSHCLSHSHTLPTTTQHWGTLGGIRLASVSVLASATTTTNTIAAAAAVTTLFLSLSFSLPFFRSLLPQLQRISIVST